MDKPSSDFIAQADRRLREERERGTAKPRSSDTGRTPAERLLETALATIGQRRANYGPAQEHFRRTIGMVNALLAHKLKEPLTAADWATIMICDKMSRAQERPIEDNPVDAAGYAALWYECLKCE